MARLIVALLVLFSLPAAAQDLLRLQGGAYARHGDIDFYATHPAEKRPTGTWLVVALHGCHQDAEGYFTKGGWADMAAAHPITVMVPEFTGNWTNSAHCWEWWERGEIRGSAGSQSRALADAITAYRKALGEGPVFVTGLSAGAAMTQVLAGTWPDRFQGAAMVAGVPYGCSMFDTGYDTTCKQDSSCRLDLGIWLDPWIYPRFTEAASCMENGYDVGPVTWAGLVGKYSTQPAGPFPSVLIVQGAADPTVDCLNAREMAEQWAKLHGVQAPLPGCDMDGATARRAGAAPVEILTLPNFGHAQPVNDGCGQPDPDEYYARADVCAAAEAMRFFGEVVGN